MDVASIRNEMLTEARAAADAMYKRLGGDGMACGFAWVTVYPRYKGNTRSGREERRVFKELGLRKDWTEKNYEIWNPSGSPVQNIDIKEAGANAAALVLRRHGFDAYPHSRLD